MKAILTRSYACAPEGHTVLKFEAGSVLEGRAAELALADGAAVEANAMPVLETKIEPPTETKKRGRPRKEA